MSFLLYSNGTFRDPNTTYRDLSVTLHHGDLNVLCSSLYDFEQTLDGQPNRIVPRLVLLVVLFQKLSDGLG
jgi:hypothetical protein